MSVEKSFACYSIIIRRIDDYAEEILKEIDEYVHEKRQRESKEEDPSERKAKEIKEQKIRLIISAIFSIPLFAVIKPVGTTMAPLPAGFRELITCWIKQV